jgi:hypothetical protein
MVLWCRRDDGFDIVHWKQSNGTPPGALAGVRLGSTEVLWLQDRRTPRTPPFDARGPRYNLSIPLLKSNLQKAVRRKTRDPALRTAWWLLCKAPAELLRRLPVILCEDTQLHERCFLEVVWLMAAVTKGYCLTWGDAAWIMSAVATALESPGRWNLEVPGPPSARFGTFAADLLPLALHVRAAFGGMTGDVAFLARLRDRATAGTLPLWLGDPVWLEEDIPWLDPDTDILLEAVDFHVYPRMLDELPGLSREAVWWCRSAPNLRPYVGEGAEIATALEVAHRERWTPCLVAHARALELFARRMRRRADREITESQPKQQKTTLDRWFKH